MWAKLFLKDGEEGNDSGDLSSPMITTETDTASIASPSPTAIGKKRYTNLSICINKMYLKTLIDRINTSKI